MRVFYKMQEAELGLGEVAPPVQPSLISSFERYQQILLKWNPVNLKNLALFCEFTTGSPESCTFPMFPDNCMKIIFKCNSSVPESIV